MKKLAIFLVLALCLTLCGCPAAESTQQTSPSLVDKEVHITAGKIEPGMTAKDIWVEVTIDHQPVSCRVQLTGFAWDGYWEMAENEPVPENFFVRLDVFYSLPKGYDVDQINVTMECDGGLYDGTGSISNDAEGNIEAWSRAFYGEEPTAPETQPSENETQPSENTTQPSENQTQPTTPPQTTPIATTPVTHVHSWEEQQGPSTTISCTMDFVKTYSCTCGEGKQEIIPAPGHDMQDGAVRTPTCTDSGSQTKRCSRCSYSYVIEIPATGHSWSDWAHETGRVHKRTCSTCSAEETQDHTVPAGDVICTGCGEAIIN